MHLQEIFDLNTWSIVLYIMWPMYLQSFKLLPLMVKVMHFTRKYIIWSWLKGQGGQGYTKCCPLPSTSCDLCTYRVWSYYLKWLRRRCFYKRIHYLTFDLRVKVTQNVNQYPLHHVTYSATKFEVATSKGLGGDAFTRKYIIWPLKLTLGSRSHKCCQVPSTSCDLFGYKVWRCTSNI